MKRDAIFIEEMESPLGTLTIAAFEDSLCHICFGAFEETKDELTEWADKHGFSCAFHSGNEWTHKAIEQLHEYFQGKRRRFDVPMTLLGTPFQQMVWRALQTIAYGETKTYKDIAEMIGRPKAVRAIGGANHNNPLSIIIPCHRVIGANGDLIGYGGGLDKKAFLLNLERV